MGMMMGGGRDFLSKDAIKPKNLFATLARFGGYFRPYLPAVLLVAVLLFGSTWAQVVQPDLTRGAVDCYFTPSSSCTYTAIPEKHAGYGGHGL